MATSGAKSSPRCAKSLNQGRITGKASRLTARYRKTAAVSEKKRRRSSAGYLLSASRIESYYRLAGSPIFAGMGLKLCRAAPQTLTRSLSAPLTHWVMEHVTPKAHRKRTTTISSAVR